MFAFLARFAQKFRILIILAWVGAAVALFLTAPSLADVGVTDESQFLPKDTESAEARRIIDEKFPSAQEEVASTGIIVIHNETGLTEDNYAEAMNVRDWLLLDSAPDAVESVTSVFDNEALASTLVSADNTTMLISVGFSAGALSDAGGQAIAEIRDYLKVSHPNLETYVSGEIALFQDLYDSVQKTIDKTTLVTIILVVVLLLLIYRSPVAILVPLLSIGASFLVARGILGYLAGAGMDISTLVDAYLVVVIFGVGTDYCLFIISRFREELRQRDNIAAQGYAMRNIGPVIAASALTVVAAFMALGISRFGMMKTTGYALAIGVSITLLAGLTLVPALISLFGRKLFWPTKTRLVERREGRFSWASIGRMISRHPVFVAIPIVLLLCVPYIAVPNLVSSSDLRSQMPQGVESVQGYNIISDNFDIGSFSPVNLLVVSPKGDITGQSSRGAIEELALFLEEDEGVARVDYYSAPADSIAALAAQTIPIGNAVGSGIGLEQLAQFEAYGDALQAVALRYPGIVQSPNFQQAAVSLGTISALAGQIQTTPVQSLPQLLAQLKAVIDQLGGNLNGLASEFRLEAQTPFTAYLLSTYFSADGTTARINITLTNEAAEDSTETIVRLRDETKAKIESSALAGSESYIGGEKATEVDIMLTNDADFGRVTALVVGGVLLIIIILLRSLLAPLYMVLTVLLNYGATIGLTTWVFIDLLGNHSIIYMLPIFVFVVLVALGADYNIFLMSRIREEAHLRPMKEAVSHAVANTGGVITACGIILAGTFATLTTAPLQIVLEIGAAIAAGILMDTFLVRALLVPSLASILGRWNWWPSRLFGELKDKSRRQ